ncbi:MAG: hypothetical protein QW215_04960, partial [Ignisphaera sp.]
WVEDVVPPPILYNTTPNQLNSSHIYPPIQILERKNYKLYSIVLDVVSYSMGGGELVETLRMRAPRVAMTILP